MIFDTHHTLQLSHSSRGKLSIEDLNQYVREAMKYWLNGVNQLFWRDWPGSRPSTFFTPEPLCHWHKAFWDHNIKWCIQAFGAEEIDFRFSLLSHGAGFQQFKEGISKLKQVTGQEHCNVVWYIISVIDGTVTKGFLITVHALMDFWYLALAPKIDNTTFSVIDSALNKFHTNKQAILDANACLCKGNKPINNWYIPKLEILHSVVLNIHANGAPYQWSANITEYAHQTVTKDPGQAENNQGYDA